MTSAAPIDSAPAGPQPDSSKPDPETRLRRVIPSPLRPDLVIQKQLFRGEEYYVIKDPLSLTYFRQQPEQAYVTSLLDGKRNLGEVYDLFQEIFPNSDWELPEVATYVNQLGSNGLLNVKAEQFAKLAKNSLKKKGPKDPVVRALTSIRKLIFMKKKLIDPSPWLDGLTRKIDFLFSRWFVGGALLFMVWSLFWLYVHRGEFADNTINFFSVHNMFLLWISIIVIKTIHEFGHACTCSHFGGEMHEMGIALICFTPCGYVDASDAWMMNKRAHKLYVTLAGIFVEFCIAGIAAHIWIYSEPGIVKNMAFNSMLAASVSTLFFNMNPLMKFDGYYIVSDVLEVPNLRTKSMLYCSYALQKYFFGIRNLRMEEAASQEGYRRVFVIYAICAYLYMIMIIYTISQIFAGLLKPYGLMEFGLALGIYMQIATFALPIVKVVSDAFSKKEQPYIVKIDNPWKVFSKRMAVFAAVIIAIAVFPTTHQISRQGVVVYGNTEQVATKVGGEVSEVYVQTRQWVNKGDPLARLSNPEIELELEVARKDFELAQLNYRALQNESSWAAASRMAESASNLEIAQSRYNRAWQDAAQLNLTSPIDGYIITPDVERLKGRYAQPNATILRVGDNRALRVIIPFKENEVELVSEGSKVTGKWVANGVKFETAIDVFPNKRARREEYLPAMLTAFGGPAPMEMGGLTDSSNSELLQNTRFPLYLAEAPLNLPEDDISVHQGMRVQTTVLGRETTYGRLVLDQIKRFLKSKSRI